MRGFTALVVAIMEGHVEAVKAILEGGADPNLRVQGVPPLIHAIIRPTHAVELAKLLLEHGAVLNAASTSNHDTALHRAIAEGSIEAVNFLIEKGMDIEKTDGRGATALLVAAAEGKTKVAGILLAHGADINARSYNGGTVLSWSTRNNHVDTMRFWLDHGVDIEGKDGFGHSKMSYWIWVLLLLTSRSCTVYCKPLWACRCG
jgi:ankyrin repeat protein